MFCIFLLQSHCLPLSKPGEHLLFYHDLLTKDKRDFGEKIYIYKLLLCSPEAASFDTVLSMALGSHTRLLFKSY